MVLRLKTWESRSPPGHHGTRQPHQHGHTPSLAPFRTPPHPPRPPGTPAGWSSPVARPAHNLKVAGSNPAPATKTSPRSHSVSGVFCIPAHSPCPAAGHISPVAARIRAHAYGFLTLGKK